VLVVWWKPAGAFGEEWVKAVHPQDGLNYDSQLARVSQIPNFMPFMNNHSVVSAQTEEFKIKNIFLPVMLLKVATESTILCALPPMYLPINMPY
jgi:hypothetical protein